MYLRKPKITKGSIAVETWYEDANGDEQDCTAWVWVSEPEPDVGHNGDIELECVMRGKVDITMTLTDEQLEGITERADEGVSTMDEEGEP